MTRPRIAVTGGCDEAGARTTQVGLDYTASVEEAGGLPLIVAVPHRVRQGGREEATVVADRVASEILSLVEGLLVTGGGDLDPDYFGEAPLAQLGTLEPARDALELALIRAALANGTPILGICRGVQVLAVAAGGSLYQDLGTQRKGVHKHHQLAPRDARTHYVDVRPDTFLATLLGAGRVKVNSFHHQAVVRLPDGFVTSAVAQDGVIEAIERDQVLHLGAAPAFGVQWHPENLWMKERVFLRLFEGLVEAAARRRGGR